MNVSGHIEGKCTTVSIMRFHQKYVQSNLSTRMCLGPAI
jgi:hypothetical protein